MNRRKALFAMLCTLAGIPVIAQESGEVFVVGPQDLKVDVQEPVTFEIDLKTVERFVFKYEEQTVTLTADDIWQELNPHGAAWQDHGDHATGGVYKP